MHTRSAGAAQAGQYLSFRTTCGRAIRVGFLTLRGIQPPVQRVSLDISPVSADGEETWVGFTVAEARQVAAGLLAQAAAAERGEPAAWPRQRRSPSA
jgi:hypothetical protein